MKWLDYREQMGIGFDDSQKANMFRNKITALLTTVSSHLTKHDFTPYYVTVGEAPPWCNYADFKWVIASITEDSDMRIILSKIVAFINSGENYIFDPDMRELICNCVLGYLTSTKIDYDLVKDDDGIFIFPRGAKELDDALVSQPLTWLSAYPQAHIAFVKALKAYSEATPDTASEIADKFRKALETFFQEFFGGGRSLEKYVSDHTYEQYLDNCGVPSDMRDEFKNTINAYTKFINNNAKHHDKTELKVLEYLMYQTGNIIRLLITLRQEEHTHAD